VSGAHLDGFRHLDRAIELCADEGIYIRQSGQLADNDSEAKPQLAFVHGSDVRRSPFDRGDIGAGLNADGPHRDRSHVTGSQGIVVASSRQRRVCMPALASIDGSARPRTSGPRGVQGSTRSRSSTTKATRRLAPRFAPFLRASEPIPADLDRLILEAQAKSDRDDVQRAVWGVFDHVTHYRLPRKQRRHRARQLKGNGQPPAVRR
jgi:hypothetical protein